MKKVITAAVIIILVLSLVFAYFSFREAPVEGEKTVTVEVTSQDGTVKSYTVETDAAYLGEVMEETEGLTVEYSDDGMIITVNGEFAEYTANNAYWALYVNGEYGNYGADKQPVTDGDVYGIVYTAA